MLRAALVLVWLACCPRPGPAQDLPVPGGSGAAGPPLRPPDVVAVGDVHGDLFYNLATLHSAGVIDAGVVAGPCPPPEKQWWKH